MGLLVACKNEEDPIKNEEARVVTTLIINLSDPQGQLTPKSVMEYYGNLNLFELFFMVGLVICKNEEDSSKNEGTRVVTIFLPL